MLPDGLIALPGRGSFFPWRLWGRRWRGRRIFSGEVEVIFIEAADGGLSGLDVKFEEVGLVSLSLWKTLLWSKESESLANMGMRC